MEHFISKIQLKKLRHLENIDIILSDNQRKHLLLTGKNGSGRQCQEFCIIRMVDLTPFFQRKIFRVP